MINVCVPVLRRYDLLRALLCSLPSSTAQPDAVYIVNNGNKAADEIYDELMASGYFRGSGFDVHVYEPPRPFGVAESWNWFIRNVPEDRIICNDDIQFSPNSIDTIVNTPGDLVFMNNCGFSCFLIRDRCVELVGEFDETISPGYAYYEDVDYAYRMIQVLPPERRPRIDAGILHEGSATFRAGTPDEVKEHWHRFHLAKSNFEKKWGFSVESLAGVV